MGGPILTRRLDDLRVFIEYWDDAEHSFLCRKLQRQLSALYRASNSYLSYYACNTFYGPPETEYVRVHPGLRRSNPIRFDEIVKELHNMADSVVRLHAGLIREGKKRIHAASISDSTTKSGT